jgi:hypothetical protein
MTFTQEEALYDFIENAAEPFTLDTVAAYLRSIDSRRNSQLAAQITALINIKRLAFSCGPRVWVARKGVFEKACFVIKPSRTELINGILVAGHRCVPFANPVLRPKEYLFFWRKKAVPLTTTESEPEELYPYYSLFGEEFSPQYIVWDNKENEYAYSSAYSNGEEPSLVSISTLDMSNIYRETGFAPGDCFIVTMLDWKKGCFSLEKVSKDFWSESDLQPWVSAAEEGFKRSFNELGVGMSTEEQIAYAYFYGGRRMRDAPAYALEEFLYEKTDRIEITPYGLETRFWFAGRDIPDEKTLLDSQYIADKTVVEEILFSKQIPISEFTAESYIKDALFRGETSVNDALLRLVPERIAKTLNAHERNILADYIAEAFEEFYPHYSLFTERAIAPLRQKLTELHTAVVEFAAMLSKNSVSAAYMPRHSFIILSQIQAHLVNMLDDIAVSGELSDMELDALEGSYENILDTYEDLRDMVDESFEVFRKTNIFLAKEENEKKSSLLQLSVGGTDVWRRLIIPGAYNLETLHRIIQNVFHWENDFPYCFKINAVWKDEEKTEQLDPVLTTIESLFSRRIGEVLYEYGELWIVKIIALSAYESGKSVVCIAGEKAAPPESVNGPIRFRKDLLALRAGSGIEKRGAIERLGAFFDPDFFDIDECNQILSAMDRS